ncbi:putative baseplate assembly protein [Xanthomonas sp. WHRI 7945]|nr:putative baseplate assembly protein [Xanthomonas campestris pv. campestris]
MHLSCLTDPRRQAVRAFQGRVGLDFVEVSDDQRALYVTFLGKLPPELREDGPGLPGHLRLEGGRSDRPLVIVDVDPQIGDGPDRDDWLVVRLDRRGDHGTYRLHLEGVAGLDPMYASAAFSFKVGCPAELDCASAPACVEPAPAEPSLSYLVKDYASFKRLIEDRLALISPAWQPRYVPDLGVALTELLAYAGDYLSYYQDAVATEAYLGTARQRISVRRHARLVDYRLHEGCNARAWVALETDSDLDLPAADIAFVSGIAADAPLPTVLDDERMAALDAPALAVFEPVGADAAANVRLRAAHSRIGLYDWGRDDGCLPRGATTAVLRDGWAGAEGQARTLDLRIGDVLILREVVGARSGLEADADPQRAWPVRLVRVAPDEDSLFPSGPDDPRPTPLLRIEWHAQDALPFPLCLSALGPAPACARLRDVAMAFANVLLVDHGRSTGPQDLGTVPQAQSPPECQCEGQPAPTDAGAARVSWRLAESPLTHRHAAPAATAAASASVAADPRDASPALAVLDSDQATWQPVFDLLASRGGDRHVVAEIDNDGRARVRFGDGSLGQRPRAGLTMQARYRVGNGSAGNVGAGSINRLYVRGQRLSGIDLRLGNPLPARGGVDAEPLAQARLLAPSAFRSDLQRAIVAADYARIAERDPRLQRAAAELVWTGSWYEADVALDPLGQVPAAPAVLAQVRTALERVRRMGHDLHVETASYVALDLALEVCALPGHARGAVAAALRERFGAGCRSDGQPGYFHPDRLQFGQNVRVSALVAEAMSVPGVECARVTRLQRLYAPPNRELDDGVLALRGNEIARLDADPARPEHGRLSISVGGGR